ncbi:DMT family transporter [Amorphus coralli]|uniref:DMT family transporter n=1 Tax=Amorphus coralli TaxID=340680 RepID=UPI0003785892|nr:EamA family transporter [Amorphus coralli]
MRKVAAADVGLWLALALMWSSSYTAIKIGVAALDPAVLVAGRLLVGSIVIYAALRMRGMRLSREPAVWVSYAATGLLGSAIPFLLITYGEQSVDSGLAAILMGTVPVVTLLLAAGVVPSERLTARSAIGVAGGFAGVIVLIGPSSLVELGAQLKGQVAIIGATVCYALSTVYIRRFVTRPALEMAAGSLLVATVFMIGIVTVSGAGLSTLKLTPASLGVIVYLGLFSTACANLIYFHLVPRLGATRMAQVNFAVPVGGAALGALLLGESLTAQKLAALFIIVGSVYLGTTRGRVRHAAATDSDRVGQEAAEEQGATR